MSTAIRSPSPAHARGKSSLVATSNSSTLPVPALMKVLALSATILLLSLIMDPRTLSSRPANGHRTLIPRTILAPMDAKRAICLPVVSAPSAILILDSPARS